MELSRLGTDALIELLRDIVDASDSNNGESLVNCIESARELLEQLDETEEQQP